MAPRRSVATPGLVPSARAQVASIRPNAEDNIDPWDGESSETRSWERWTQIIIHWYATFWRAKGQASHPLYTLSTSKQSVLASFLRVPSRQASNHCHPASHSGSGNLDLADEKTFQQRGGPQRPHAPSSAWKLELAPVLASLANQCWSGIPDSCSVGRRMDAVATLTLGKG